MDLIKTTLFVLMANVYCMVHSSESVPLCVEGWQIFLMERPKIRDGWVTNVTSRPPATISNTQRSSYSSVPF